MNIGLIAHDGKKKLMQNFCIAYRGILNKHELFATATTGRLIEEVTNLTIHKYLAGPLGGEQQMASQIEHNLIDMVIFLRDPQNQQVHEPDIFNVMHLCDVQIGQKEKSDYEKEINMHNKHFGFGSSIM